MSIDKWQNKNELIVIIQNIMKELQAKGFAAGGITGGGTNTYVAVFSAGSVIGGTNKVTWNGSVFYIDGSLQVTGAVAANEPVDFKTDNYAVLTTDFDHVLVMNSAADKTFALPSVDASHVGTARLLLVKYGTGKMTIDPADNDVILTSWGVTTVGTGVLFNAVEQYAAARLRLITATEWLLEAWTGTGWVKT